MQTFELLEPVEELWEPEHQRVVAGKNARKPCIRRRLVLRKQWKKVLPGCESELDGASDHGVSKMWRSAQSFGLFPDFQEEQSELFWFSYSKAPDASVGLLGYHTHGSDFFS